MKTIQRLTGPASEAHGPMFPKLPVATYHEVARSRGVGATPGANVAVVGLDSSTDSSAALRWASEWARQRRAQVVAVHAVRLASALIRDIPPFGLAPWRADLRRRIAAEWCRPLQESGVTYTALVADETASHAIVRVADHYDAKIIVIGATSARFLHHPLGGVGDRVIHASHRPVTVIPALEP